MRSCLRSSPGRFQVYSALLAAVLGSFVRVVHVGAELSDVLDKEVKDSGYPVLGGPFWARLPKMNDLADDFLWPYADPVLHGNSDWAVPLARMDLRAFAAPVPI